MVGNGLSHGPFVSVFSRIGIPYAEDIIRFVIITALLSAANSGLYAALRMLWSLSDQNKLPKVFSKLSHSGTPLIAIMATMLGALPGLLSEFFAPKAIFVNLLNIAAFTMVIVWISICISQLNFRRERYKAGKTRQDLKFSAPLYPIVPILGGIFCLITGLSMAVDPSMRASFIGCLVIMMLCYVHYYWRVKPRH